MIPDVQERRQRDRRAHSRGGGVPRTELRMLLLNPRAPPAKQGRCQTKWAKPMAAGGSSAATVIIFGMNANV
jgi:hypothetical protein